MKFQNHPSDATTALPLRFDLQLFAEDSEPEGGQQNEPENKPQGNTEPPEENKNNPPQDPRTLLNDPTIKEFLNQQLQAVRQQEKDKLYATLDEYKRENSELRHQLKELRTQLEELQKNSNQQNQQEPEAPKGDNEVKDQKTNEGAPESQQPAVPSELADLIKQLQEQVKSVAEEVKKDKRIREQEELRRYREQAIARAQLPEHFHSLIPETSKDSIDKAINSVLEGLRAVSPPPVPQQRTSGSLLTSGARVPSAPNTTLGIQNQEITPELVASWTPEQYQEFRKNNPHMFSGGQRTGFQSFGGAGIRRQ